MCLGLSLKILQTKFKINMGCPQLWHLNNCIQPLHFMLGLLSHLSTAISTYVFLPFFLPSVFFIQHLGDYNALQASYALNSCPRFFQLGCHGNW